VCKYKYNYFSRKYKYKHQHLGCKYKYFSHKYKYKHFASSTQVQVHVHIIKSQLAVTSSALSDVFAMITDKFVTVYYYIKKWSQMMSLPLRKSSMENVFKKSMEFP